MPAFRHSALFRSVAMALGVLVQIGAPRAAPAEDADWPQFRGPGARGVADRARVPDQWSETRNIVWKQPIAGRGWSSPIIVGGRVFLTTVTRETGDPEEAKTGLYFGGDRAKPDDVVHDWRLLCFKLADGELLWSTSLHRAKPTTPRHIKNSYASETPVTDGERVVVLFGDIGLFCVGMDGAVVWKEPMSARKTRFDWGPAASPALHQDRVYIVSDNEEASFLAAFDKRTGKQLWRVERREKSNWATPFIWRNELREEIITPGTGKTRAYDLDGKLLYEFGGASSITIATPYAAHGLLYVSSGYVLDPRRPIFAIRPGAAGDISLSKGATSNEFVVWSQPHGAPYNPSTIVVGEQLYVLHDRGFLSSYDAKTGAPIYENKRVPNGRAFTASPWSTGGKIFCLNEQGATFVFDTGREFRLLHVNPLECQQICMATPAIANDRLLLRTGDALYCIGETSRDESKRSRSPE